MQSKGHPSTNLPIMVFCFKASTFFFFKNHLILIFFQSKTLQTEKPSGKVYSWLLLSINRQVNFLVNERWLFPTCSWRQGLVTAWARATLIHVINHVSASFPRCPKMALGRTVCKRQKITFKDINVKGNCLNKYRDPDTLYMVHTYDYK